MKTITMVAMFKDLRQVEELGCCNEDLANQYSWIDEEIQKRIVQQKVNIYRQMKTQILPNNQAYAEG